MYIEKIAFKDSINKNQYKQKLEEEYEKNYKVKRGNKRRKEEKQKNIKIHKRKK